ncbi:unnamed protein product [marine sediment metagenome]|uniref:Uncharacterized protein n=1 Tax=marine sediment metagenome TaxID=412755 RepID=X1REZ8_9ZZZZ
MKTNVSQYDFERAFVDMGRSDNFSYEGLNALYDWLCEMDDDCGTETELDVIALCCEFSEYDNFAEFQDNYTDCPDCYIQTVRWINDRTTYIEIPNTNRFIIQDF